jgi:hypothetical protein
MDGTIRDRVREFRRVPARELLDNDGNPRRHPQAQRDALRGVLEQVGIAAALVAYHSERNCGKLTLVDGHLRRQDYDLDWPTLILDVADAEADLLLATHDPLAALAEYDRPRLDALLQEVRARRPAVVGMLKDLAKGAGKDQGGTGSPGASSAGAGPGQMDPTSLGGGAPVSSNNHGLATTPGGQPCNTFPVPTEAPVLATIRHGRGNRQRAQHRQSRHDRAGPAANPGGGRDRPAAIWTWSPSWG